MGYSEGRIVADLSTLRLDRACKGAWEGELGKCKRRKSKGEELYEEKIKSYSVKGQEAVESIRGGGFPLSTYIKDPEGTKIALQRRYMDMMQATGGRMIVPKIAETKADISNLINRDKDIKRNLTTVEPKNMTTLEKAYSNSRKGVYRDVFHDDLAWAEKNKKKLQQANLSPTEGAIVRDYARPGTYRLINGMARNMPETYYPPYGALKPYQGMSQSEIENVGSRSSRLLSGAIKKMPKHEGVTYRGLQLPQEAIDSLIKEGEWQEDGFMSTTKDLSLAYPGNVVYRIYSNKGADISPIEPILNKEVLFPKKSTLKLKNYRKMKRFGKEFYVMDFVV